MPSVSFAGRLSKVISKMIGFVMVYITLRRLSMTWGLGELPPSFD